MSMLFSNGHGKLASFSMEGASSGFVAELDMKAKEKKMLVNVIDSLLPLIEEFVSPVKHLLSLIEEGKDEEIPGFFLGVLGEYTRVLICLKTVQSPLLLPVRRRSLEGAIRGDSLRPHCH